jgi:hypothetical protein
MGCPDGFDFTMTMSCVNFANKYIMILVGRIMILLLDWLSKGELLPN